MIAIVDKLISRPKNIVHFINVLVLLQLFLKPHCQNPFLNSLIQSAVYFHLCVLFQYRNSIYAKLILLHSSVEAYASVIHDNSLSTLILLSTIMPILCKQDKQYT